MPREFKGPTMRGVLDQVRDACGVDAMILSQSQSADGVTVVVAEPLADRSQTAQPGVGSVTPLREPTHENARPDRVVDRSTDAARDSDLRFAAIDPGWSRKLADLGFSRAFACDVDSGIQSEAELEQAVLARIPIERLPRRLQGRWRVLGAAGVGKTTTAIKLLASRALHAGPSGIRAMTTDTQRLGGDESLLLACELLGMQSSRLSQRELASALEPADADDLVIVDTPALTLDGLDRQAFAELPGVRDVLVLPATWRGEIAGRWLDACGRRAGACAVLTHVDEAPDIAAVCSELAVRKIPLIALGTGSSLPESLEPADPSLLAKLLFARSVPGHGQTRIADYA